MTTHLDKLNENNLNRLRRRLRDEIGLPDDLEEFGSRGQLLITASLLLDAIDNLRFNLRAVEGQGREYQTMLFDNYENLKSRVEKLEGQMTILLLDNFDNLKSRVEKLERQLEDKS